MTQENKYETRGYDAEQQKKRVTNGMGRNQSSWYETQQVHFTLRTENQTLFFLPASNLYDGVKVCQGDDSMCTVHLHKINQATQKSKKKNKEND